jgi:hypothetical protein
MAAQLIIRFGLRRAATLPFQRLSPMHRLGVRHQVSGSASGAAQWNGRSSLPFVPANADDGSIYCQAAMQAPQFTVRRPGTR